MRTAPEAADPAADPAPDPAPDSAPDSAGAARWRRLLPDAAWAAVVVLVCVVSRSELRPGALLLPVQVPVQLPVLPSLWPVLGLAVLWALRHRHRRARLLVLLAAGVLDAVSAGATGAGAGEALAGGAGVSAGAAATLVCLEALERRGGGAARAGGAWSLLAAAVVGALVSSLVRLGLGGDGAVDPSQLAAELVHALTGSFVLLAAARRFPGRADDGPAAAGPLEVAAVWVGGLGVFAAVFVVVDGVPIAFTGFPVAVWAALRLPRRWAGAHLLVSSALVVGGSALGRGPFTGQGPTAALLLAQGCACAMAMVALVAALHREERVVAERRLDSALAGARDHGALLGAVHAAVSHGIAIYAADGSLLQANPAARELLGPNTREASPRSWEGVYEVRLPDGSPVAPQQLPVSRALAGEEVTGVDLLVSDPGGSGARVLGVDAHPLPASAGAAWSGGAVVVFHDVTDERAQAAAAEQARELLAGVLDGATTQGILATDPDHRITVFSSGAERLLGWAAAEVVGDSPLRFVRHAEVHERAVELGVPVGPAALLAGLAEGGHTTRRWTLVRRDGSTFTGEVTLTQTRDDDGALRSTTAVITDVTAEVAADQRRAEAELQFRLAFETAPTGMVLMSLRPGEVGRLTRVNDAFAALTGRPRDELLTLLVRDLLHPDDVPGHVERLELIAGERLTETTSREQRFTRPDGSVRWGRTSPSLIEPADGGAPHLLVVVEDVTEQHRTQQALVHAALHDPLTGLPNRALLARRLEEALRADAEALAGVTVLYVDLDGFKPVNDAHGHAAGDELLRVVADRLRRTVRSGDTVARLGGDEFALLCPGLAADRVPDLLARVDAAVTAPVPLPDGTVVRVSASAGTASAVGEDDAQRLLDEADHGMYAEKRRRRRAAGGTERGAGRLPG